MKVLTRKRLDWLKANPAKTPDDLPDEIAIDGDEPESVYSEILDALLTEFGCDTIGARACRIRAEEISLDRVRSYAATINGVEIFQTGNWNGDKYTTADLDDMVANFGKMGVGVPIKLGHDEVSGAQAFGWVSRLRRVGNKLVADFTNVPDKLARAVQDRRFDHVSVEVFFDRKVNGTIFRRALKAVAFLGAETPAVNDLSPLSAAEIVFAGEGGSVSAHQFETDGVKLMATKKTDDAKTVEIDEAELAELRKFKAENEKATGTLVKGLNDANDRIKELTERLDGEAHRRIESEIDRKIDKITIPSLRSDLRALYRGALEHEDVRIKVFTEVKGDDGETKRVEGEISILDAVDSLIGKINKLAAKNIFSEFSVDTDDPEPRRGDDGESHGDKVHALAQKLVDDGKAKTYREALRKVHADPANADLVHEYGRPGAN